MIKRAFIGFILCAYIVIGAGLVYFTPYRPLDYEFDEGGEWRLRPSQMGFEWKAFNGAKTPPITIDAQGFRAAYHPARPSKRILAIGSENALGVGVYDHETWAARLEQMLGDDTAIYNAANPGWGPSLQSHYLIHNVERIKPHLVVVSVNKYDLNYLPFNSDQSRAHQQKMRKMQKLQEFNPLLARSVFVSTETIKQSIDKAKWIWGQRSVYEPSTKALLNEQSPYWQEIISLCEQQQIPLVFFIPNIEQDKANDYIAIHLEMISDKHQHVKVVEQNRNTLVSVSDFYTNHYRLSQPNANYHQMMALALKDSLQQAL